MPNRWKTAALAVQKPTSCLWLTRFQATAVAAPSTINMSQKDDCPTVSIVRVKQELPAPHHSTPVNNYLSGDAKSYIWAAPAYYVPSERTWIRYPDYRSLPRETRRDVIDFQSEDQWVDFMRHRDQPSGYYHSRVGIRPTNLPPLKLNGYTRTLPCMPSTDTFSTPWPKCDAWTPPIRRGRGEYYGYYHERIEKERDRRWQELPHAMKVEPHHTPTYAYNSRWGFYQP
ncbi:hypothetical protein BaRGS_00036469 [Batillaria attramentaria]|uniref:Uncharacterized protein n=1 Tax=Batillaria attramentaria TaxID=370345 RepID=A0ABD0JBU9_9CAEN